MGRRAEALVDGIGAGAVDDAKPVDGPTVFVSYAHADQEFVRRIEAFLKRRGVEVWLDERSAAPGDFLTSAIGAGLANASAVVVVLSQASVASRWVQYEIDTVFPRVVNGECRLVPLLIDAVAVPPKLSGLIYADFRTSRQAGYQGLAHGLGVEFRTKRRAARPDEVEPAADALVIAARGVVRSSPPFPLFDAREAFLVESLNRVFDRSNLSSLPPGGPTIADFAGRANDEDRWYEDDIEIYYEPQQMERLTIWPDPPQVWPPVRDLDDDFSFDFKNALLDSGGSSSYYHLLLADRPVTFAWPIRPQDGDGRVQIDGIGLDSNDREEPTELWICVDVSGIDDSLQVEKYLRVAREAFRRDGERRVNEKWQDQKPWEE